MADPATRHFLGWSRPAVAAAAAWLETRFARQSCIDLSGAILVVPGSRARAKLLDALMQAAAARGGAILGHTIVTVGAFLRMIMPAQAPELGALERRALWARAAQSLVPADLKALLPSPPPPGDTTRWLAIGELLASCHRDVLGDATTFADIAAALANAPEISVSDRWRAMQAAEASYVRSVKSLGRSDAAWECLAAVREGAIDRTREVVLVGVTDAPRTLRMAIELLGERAAALIMAPDECEAGFDAAGCIVPEYWAGRECGLTPEQVSFTDSPAAQAEAALVCLSDLPAPINPARVVIAVPDAEVVPHLRRLAADHPAEYTAASGKTRQRPLAVRAAAGDPAACSSAIKLLASCAAFVSEPTIKHLAELAMHPAIERLIDERLGLRDGRLGYRGWLDCITEYETEHLPARVVTSWPGASEEQRAVLDAAIAVLADVLTELMPPEMPESHQPRAASSWAEPIVNVIRAANAGRPLRQEHLAERWIIEGAGLIQDACDDLAALASLGDSEPQLSAAQAMSLIVQAVSENSIPEPEGSDAIELVGWLELFIDDAEFVVLTGMNEGRVSAGKGADPLLTDSVRRKLGLHDSSRTYARDLYLFTNLLATRRARIIAGRHGSDGSPLYPSRLLLACEADTQLHILRRYAPSQSSGKESPVTPRLARALSPAARTRFAPRPIVPARAITSMNVTDFGRYLSSPYMFYLERVLRLKEVQPPDHELDPSAFGQLIHNVLSWFRTTPAIDSTDANEIARTLHLGLDQLLQANYPEPVSNAVWIQAEQARRRLAAFAEKQADWRRAGWRTIAAEWQPEPHVMIVDDQPMRIHGRVDRVDADPEGNLAILDYKTSAAGLEPEKDHRRSGAWVNLQLPLYRLFAPSLHNPLAPSIDPQSRLVRVGYITLPKSEPDTQFVLADWNDDDFDQAMNVAHDVIRAVRRGDFGELGAKPPEEGVFAAICGTSLLGSARGADDEDGDQA